MAAMGVHKRPSNMCRLPKTVLLLSLIVLLGNVVGVEPEREKACKIFSAGTQTELSDFCNCSGQNVICNSKGLKAIPINILLSVEIITMNNNSITAITEDDFAGLEFLRTLFLQDNQIAYIHQNAFRNLYRLEILNLERNRMSGTLDPSGLMFQHLPSISVLALQSNKIRNLNKYSFITLIANSQKVEVKLTANPVECDCNVKAIRDWENGFTSDRINFVDLRCDNDASKRAYRQVPETIFGNCSTYCNITEEPSPGETDNSYGDGDGSGNGKNNNGLALGLGKNNGQGKGQGQGQGQGLAYGKNNEPKNDRKDQTTPASDSLLGNILDSIFSSENASDIVANSGEIFDPSFTCPRCSDEKTNYGCMKQRRDPCSGFQMVCRKRVTWREATKQIAITSTCEQYQQCLVQEMRNKETCGQGYTPPDIGCDFCCVGPTCQNDTVGGRTVDYSLIFSYVREGAPFQAFMTQPSSLGYQREEERIATLGYYLGLQMKNIKAGIDVHLLRFEPQNNGRHKVVIQIEVTAFAPTSLNTTIQALRQSAIDDMYSTDGFLYRENIYMNEWQLENVFGNQSQCTEGYTMSDKGRFYWPTVNVNTTISVTCPYAKNNEFATRLCFQDSRGNVRWEAPNKAMCPSEASTPADTTTIDDILAGDITPANAVEKSSDLKELMEESQKHSPEFLNKVVDALDLLTKPENLQEEGVAENVVETLNDLIDVDEESLKSGQEEEKTSQRLLNIIDKVADTARLDNNGQLKVVTPNLAVVAQRIVPNENRDVKLSAGTGTDDNLDADQIKVDFLNGNPASENDGTNMILPTQALRQLATAQDKPLERASFSVHKSDKLFASIGEQNFAGPTTTTTTTTANPSVVSDNDVQAEEQRIITKINSNVISASVPGVAVQGLNKNVTMTFKHEKANATRPRCVFWDESMFEKTGGWSNRGCGVVASGDDTTTCGCNHLTNFALLMDVYQEGSSLSELDRTVLSIISYVGCAVSLLALIMTLLTYSLFSSEQVNTYSLSDHTQTRRKLRRDNPSKILINLSIALLFSNLVYLVGMHDYTFDNNISCKVVAVLLHYFLLASLCWMVVEAFYMYLALILVFKTYFTNFILKCSLVGWGVPLVIVVVTLAVNTTDNYGLLNTGLCWLHNPAFYAAFVGPVCLILFINCLAFGLVVKQLMSMSNGKLNKTDRNNTVQRLRGAVGVVILLGLTWLFAVFAIGQASVVFYYLFAIFNSLQGLFIFIFYCVLKKDAMKAWKRSLPCFEEYGEASKSSSNSRVATGTNTVHQRTKNNKYSDTSTSNNTNSTSVTDGDSSKNSYFNSVNSNGKNVYNNVDEAAVVSAETKTGKVNYGPPASSSSPPPSTLSTQQHPTSPPPYSFAKPESPGPQYENTKQSPIAVFNRSFELEKPSSPPASSPSSPKTFSSGPSSPAGYSQSSVLGVKAEGEIDTSNTAKVSAIKLKFERTFSDTSDREITKI